MPVAAVAAAVGQLVLAVSVAVEMVVLVQGRLVLLTVAVAVVVAVPRATGALAAPVSSSSSIINP
jgi:hypothetical protein